MVRIAEAIYDKIAIITRKNSVEKSYTKFEYIFRNVCVKDFKRMLVLLGPKGTGCFSSYVTRYLDNIDTKDTLVLSIIPGYDKPERIKEFQEGISRLYEEMNEICRRNGIPSFFPDPKNLVASEAIRRDLIAPLSEYRFSDFVKEYEKKASDK